MRKRSSKRFKIETALAATSLMLCVLALFWRDWIEFVFRVDPDRHSGSLEWLVIGVLALISLTATVQARLDWLRLDGSVPPGVAGS